MKSNSLLFSCLRPTLVELKQSDRNGKSLRRWVLHGRVDAVLGLVLQA